MLVQVIFVYLMNYILEPIPTKLLQAYAFIDYLARNNNIKFVLTTHFIDICEKLDVNDNIINLHAELLLQMKKYLINIKSIREFLKLKVV